MALKTKRIYEPFETSDGYRILVDRLWPRGIKKEEAHVDKWLKEAAPSTVLRKWFNHEPEKWKAFVVKYHSELNSSAAFDELLAAVGKHKTVTLLYAAKDEEHNHSLVLKELITKHKKA
jgi:uncharacterized protein YeaO (DUF488 family)